jgi:hypothetical protein
VTSIAELSARWEERNGSLPEDPREQLEHLLGLDKVDVGITGVRMFGRGSRASIDVCVCKGDAIQFESVAKMARPQAVMAEVAACTGARPALKQSHCLHVIALARGLAEHLKGSTEDVSIAWGVEFLQRAETLDISLNDQHECWGAFDLIARRDPHVHARDESHDYVRSCIVLRDVSGASWCVRAGSWRSCGASHLRKPRAACSTAWRASAGSVAAARDESRLAVRGAPESSSGPFTSRLRGGRSDGWWDDGTTGAPVFPRACARTRA